jgi:hypothetical protein
MKKFFGYLLFLLGAILLIELNSGTLTDDFKAIFKINQPKEIPDNLYYSDEIPKDYLQLIHHIRGKDINFLKTTKGKFRNPISCFIYNQQYYIQIYKMDSLFNYSLKSNLKEDFGNAKKSSNVFYSVDDRSKIEYSYKLTAPTKPTSVFLKVLGKNNRILLKNDSIAYYYSDFKNFSIKYDPTGLNDIYGETKGGLFSKVLPIEILFIKRDHSLYLLTMSVYEDASDSKYAPGILYNLINH